MASNLTSSCLPASVSCSVAAASQPPRADGAGEVQRALDAWARSHGGLSAAAWRLEESGPVPVAQYREETPRIPASNEKLVTSAAALISLGPDFRFRTRLFRDVRTTRTGRVLRGPVYVKGYGDPTLATRPFARSFQSDLGGNFARLFLPLRRDGVRAVRGPIVADESFFDSRRDGPRWRAGFSIYSRPLSALSLNRNNLGGPPRPAAVRARSALRGIGIRQTGGVRVGTTPRSATEIASIASPPLHAILGLANPASDNYQAEMLMKAVGAYGAGVGTTVAGARRSTALLRERGILNLNDRIVDGSGLSHANRLSAASLTRLMAAADRDPEWGRALIRSLPQGGEGTLRRRFLGSARHRVRAKTGTLSGVTSLAGRVVSRRGQRYAFAVLVESPNTTGGRALQDRVVKLLAAGAEDRIPVTTTLRPG